MMDVRKKERLDEDLKQVESLIRSKIGDVNLVSIVLYGSYGRGEGAFYENAHGRLEPYNDYDIVMVVKSIIETSLVRSIETDLKQMLSVRWIDISQKTISLLESLKPSIFNYDLRNGSQVIYGDQDILKKVPDFKSGNLPLIEAEVLFFTRLWCFCGSLKAEWRTESMSEEELRFFRNQMAKSILAVGDVLLLTSGDYDSSYIKRVEILSDQYSDDSELVELLKWAIDEKLTPKSVPMAVEEMGPFYDKVAKLFYDKMLWVMSRKSSRKIQSVDQYHNAARTSIEHIILVLKHLIKKRKLRTTAFSSIDWAQAYLLEFHLFRDKKSSLIKVQNTLRKHTSTKTVEVPETWDEMRLKVAEIKIGGAW